SGSQIDL
ncbi:hypothetical protein CP03DC29_0586B, partial [Chlamydia psittaci 03DC29]